MSVTYRVVKRFVGETEGKEMGRGTVATLRDVEENTPVIIVGPRSNHLTPRVYVYEVQVWSEAAQNWMWYMPLTPWKHASAKSSLSACFTSADVPLAGEDEAVPLVLTFRSIPVSDADYSLPKHITPAVAYIP